MAGSLQDQLLGKGLVSKKKAQKIQHEKRKQHKLKNKNGVEIKDDNKLAAQEAAKLKAEKDLQLNLEQKARAEEKAIKAQISQLIQTNALAPESKDVAFLFTYQGNSESIVVSRQQQEQLNKGRIAIVATGSSFECVPAPVAEKIQQRSEQAIAFKADLLAVSEEHEDPYAEFEIPDDLMW